MSQLIIQTYQQQLMRLNISFRMHASLFRQCINSISSLKFHSCDHEINVATAKQDFYYKLISRSRQSVDWMRSSSECRWKRDANKKSHEIVIFLSFHYAYDLATITTISTQVYSHKNLNCRYLRFLSMHSTLLYSLVLIPLCEYFVYPILIIMMIISNKQQQQKQESQ